MSSPLSHPFSLTSEQLAVDEDENDSRIVDTDPSGRFDRFDELIGRGAYKEVYKAFDNENAVEVAWNQLKLDHLSKRDAQRTLSEIEILQSLRNDHIINIYHSWTARGLDQKERIFFITELMTSGTLKSYIRRTKGPIKPKVLKNWCKQILLGLNYLHTRNPPVIHRDLKCENIFVNGNSSQAKIGDLGLATVKKGDHLSSVLGTPEFMAPEFYDENYTETVDVYAFGLCVLEMCTKEYPYSECTNQAQIYKKVTQGIKPLALQKIQDPETRAFIELCIQFDPKLRPQAGELLRHPFLTNTDLNSFPMEITTSIPTNNPNSKPTYANILMNNSQQIPFVTTGSSFSSNSEMTLTPSSANTNIHTTGLGDNELILDSPIKTEVPQKPEQSQSEKPDFVESDNHTYQIATTMLEWRAICTVDVVEPLNPSSEDAKMHPGMVTSDNEVMLRMVYGVAGGRSKEIKFPFNMDEDKSQDVVAEMVRESLINQEDQNIAWKCVEDAVASVRRKKSNASSLQDVPTNQQPPPTRLGQWPEENEYHYPNTDSIDPFQLDKSLPRSSSAGSLGYDATMYAPDQNTAQFYQRAQKSASNIGASVTSSVSSSSRPLTPNNNPLIQNQSISLNNLVSPPYAQNNQWNPNTSAPDVIPKRNFERNSLDEERTRQYANQHQQIQQQQQQQQQQQHQQQQQQLNSNIQSQFPNQYSSPPMSRVSSASSIPPSYLPPDMNRQSSRSSEVGATRISPPLNPVNSYSYNEGIKLSTNSPPLQAQGKQSGQLSRNSNSPPMQPQLDVNQHPAMAQLISKQQQQQIQLQQQIFKEQQQIFKEQQLKELQQQRTIETQKLAVQNQQQLPSSQFPPSQPPIG
ncbi:Serine/threonine-protein kinase wnk3 [Nowakowskiella sp. JEL0078]|nr:Serine/threonine-protein kinase wnk3 [Nowakowskiella sp. JEL0078]